MINPKTVTNPYRERRELEEFLLFSIVVAGKNAFVQAKKLDQLLAFSTMSPFETICYLDNNGLLESALRSVKMGQYKRITSAMRGCAYLLKPLSLRYVDLSLLESIKGIGMKTARFFAMHSRHNQWLACLDTHILKWLGDRGHDVPKTTPSGDKYLKLEKIFLGYCMAMNMSPAQLDLKIWNEAHQ
jgi:hypothetical protein